MILRLHMQSAQLVAAHPRRSGRWFPTIEMIFQQIDGAHCVNFLIVRNINATKHGYGETQLAGGVSADVSDYTEMTLFRYKMRQRPPVLVRKHQDLGPARVRNDNVVIKSQLNTVCLEREASAARGNFPLALSTLCTRASVPQFQRQSRPGGRNSKRAPRESAQVRADGAAGIFLPDSNPKPVYRVRSRSLWCWRP